MPLDRIYVPREERQRREVDPEKGNLLASVALRGVICPIILERDPSLGAPLGLHRLYAGERRLAASAALGLPDIPYRFAHEPDEAEMAIIEFEENAKRLDLTWQEKLEAVCKLHELYLARDPSWTLLATSEAVAVNHGDISRSVFIWEHWHDENVRACGTMNEAYNLLSRRMKRAQASKLEAWLGGEGGEEEEGEENANGVSIGDDSGVAVERGDRGLGNPVSGGQVNCQNLGPLPTGRGPQIPSPPVLPILQGDFLTWAPSYVGPKFNLIHCDFPYGIKLSIRSGSGPNTLHREEGEMYEDAAKTYEVLLSCLVEHFDRFASESCHLLFWFSDKTPIGPETRQALLGIRGLTLTRFPLVWLKSDHAGFITPGEPRHIYETCLLGSRGDRPVVKYKSDAYASPTDNTLHVSAKPEPMLRYFMEMLVDEHSRVLDPTCGSGSALRAADSLHAEHVLGLELNPEMAAIANNALALARRKRQAAAELNVEGASS